MIGAVEVLERIREHPLWSERGSLPQDEGSGLAVGYWPRSTEPAAAVCRVDNDGTMTVVTSAVDMSGVDSGFAAIAAAAFASSPSGCESSPRTPRPVLRGASGGRR